MLRFSTSGFRGLLYHSVFILYLVSQYVPVLASFRILTYVLMSLMIVFSIAKFSSMKFSLISINMFILVGLFLLLCSMSLTNFIQDIPIFLFSVQSGFLSNIYLGTFLGIIICNYNSSFKKGFSKSVFYFFTVINLITLVWFIVIIKSSFIDGVYHNPFFDHYQFIAVAVQYTLLYFLLILLLDIDRCKVSKRFALFSSCLFALVSALLGTVVGSNGHILVCLGFLLIFLMSLRGAYDYTKSFLTLACWVVFIAFVCIVFLVFLSSFFLDYVRLLDLDNVLLSIFSRLDVAFVLPSHGFELLNYATDNRVTALYPHNWPFYTLFKFGLIPFALSIILVSVLGIMIYNLKKSPKFNGRLASFRLFLFYTFLFYFLFIGFFKDTIQTSMFWVFFGFFLIISSIDRDKFWLGRA